MKILYLDDYGVKLGADGTSLKLISKKEEKIIPLWEIDLVVVSSTGISITSKALNLLAKAGIELVITDPRGSPLSMTYFSHYSRTPDTRRAQYLASFNYIGVEIAASLISCKICSQSKALGRLSNYYNLDGYQKELESISKKVFNEVKGLSIDEARKKLLEIEATAARSYWGAISRALPKNLDFINRDQDGGDPLNAALNYGYSILYSLGFRALILSGLDPYAGYMHADRSGKPVLVFDYIEQFRAPIVDEAILRGIARGFNIRLNNDKLLDKESKRNVLKLINERLKEQAVNAYRPMSFEESIKEYAFRLAKSLREGSMYFCYNFPRGDKVDVISNL
jgi:CRISPR-associated protein Cas1